MMMFTKNHLSVAQRKEEVVKYFEHWGGGGIYAYWVGCSNVAHPPLLTPPSVGYRWSVVFRNAPF